MMTKAMEGFISALVKITKRGKKRYKKRKKDDES